MTFNKDKYWERRNNTVAVLDAESKPKLDDDGHEIKKPKPLRGQGEESTPVKTTPSNAQISFTNDGTLVINNRAYRRQRTSLFPKTRQLRKKKPRGKK